MTDERIKLIEIRLDEARQTMDTTRGMKAVWARAYHSDVAPLLKWAKEMREQLYIMSQKWEPHTIGERVWMEITIKLLESNPTGLGRDSDVSTPKPAPNSGAVENGGVA